MVGAAVGAVVGATDVFVQSMESPVLYSPSADVQFRHVLCAAVGLYMLAGHDAHTPRVTLTYWYFPAAHSAHDVDPASALPMPLGQYEHVLCATESENFPAGHGVHESAVPFAE